MFEGVFRIERVAWCLHMLWDTRVSTWTSLVHEYPERCTLLKTRLHMVLVCASVQKEDGVAGDFYKTKRPSESGNQDWPLSFLCCCCVDVFVVLCCQRFACFRVR